MVRTNPPKSRGELLVRLAKELNDVQQPKEKFKMTDNSNIQCCDLGNYSVLQYENTCDNIISNESVNCDEKRKTCDKALKCNNESNNDDFTLTDHKQNSFNDMEHEMTINSNKIIQGCDVSTLGNYSVLPFEETCGNIISNELMNCDNKIDLRDKAINCNNRGNNYDFNLTDRNQSLNSLNEMEHEMSINSNKMQGCIMGNYSVLQFEETCGNNIIPNEPMNCNEIIHSYEKTMECNIDDFNLTDHNQNLNNINEIEHEMMVDSNNTQGCDLNILGNYTVLVYEETVDTAFVSEGSMNYEEKVDSFDKTIIESNNDDFSLTDENQNLISFDEIESAELEGNYPGPPEEQTILDAPPLQDTSNNKSKSIKRKIAQREKAKHKHPLRPSTCENISKKCRNNCLQNIGADQRVLLHRQFWEMSSHDQRKFILNICSKVPIKTRKVGPKINRTANFKYNLTNSAGEKFVVCKNFFLTTLGFHPNNDKVVFNVLHRTKSCQISPLADKRGMNTPSSKVDRTLIIQHIESFHPSISHYRREHAPHVRYLPNDVTKRSMHNDFIEKHPEIKCGYELYRQIVSQQNIHFTILGHEQCEVCKINEFHKNTSGHKDAEDGCVDCAVFLKHISKATQARSLYRQDAVTEFDEFTVCVSTDMEKVIMLPRMEEFKVAIFTKRLSMYNQTFVPVGNQEKGTAFSAVWHNGISGRNKEELISTYHQFFLFHRDKKKFIIWLDNCSAQNKNWALFTYLLTIINSNEIQAEEIVLKYFERGHTFMSCDSFHHQVEQSMKRMKNVYDFRDFSTAVKNAGKKVAVKEMEAGNFYQFPDFSSSHKRKKNTKDKILLLNIVSARVTRGNFFLDVKEGYNDEWVTVDFLKKSCTKSTIMNSLSSMVGMLSPRGVTADFKEEIIKKLLPLMPENRKDFWKSLKLEMD